MNQAAYLGFNPEEEAAWAVVSSSIDRLVAQVAGYNFNAMAPKRWNPMKIHLLVFKQRISIEPLKY